MLNLISHCKQLEKCLLYMKNLAPHIGQQVAQNSDPQKKGKVVEIVPICCLDAMPRLYSQRWGRTQTRAWQSQRVLSLETRV